MHTRSDDVQNLRQTPSAAADQSDIEMGKPIQRGGSRPLDHREVRCGKTCRILLDEGDSLGILFDGVDMPLRGKTRCLHRERARPRADIIDDSIGGNLCLDERENAYLLLCHRHITAHKSVIFYAEIHASSSFTAQTIITPCPIPSSRAASPSVVRTMFSSA